MIYKNKHRYKTLESRMGEFYVSNENKGYKIKVNNMIFYVNEKLTKVTEEQTGAGFFVPDEVMELETVEKYIETIYDKIKENVEKRLNKYPQLNMLFLGPGVIKIK